jgi:hypothetical protein
MSKSSVPEPRVRRKHDPARVFSKGGYRKAREFLREDFQNRCAYSMIHEDVAGGVGAMNIDHFDPRKKSNFLHRYDNLFWSSRECNGRKHQHWPTKEENRRGIRFLDCTRERDYGVHIFEDPITHEVWGATPAGVYHVRIMNLNASVFVRHRKLRAIMAEALTGTIVQLQTKGLSAKSFQASLAPFLLLMNPMRQLFELSIPPIEFRQKPIAGKDAVSST